MTLAETLIPLPVTLPLATAGFMLAVGRWLPKQIPQVAALVIALVVAAISAYLAFESRGGALAYWFGGWSPRNGFALGVGFGVEPASAAIAAFIAMLFSASFIYAWGYFDKAESLFHIVMLIFLAAMQGFCLTRDLFNLFVWFEVMSVAAFSLTAYRLETPSLAGAINFTVTSSLASFCMLAAVGLLYARGGALDFEALGQAVTRAPPGDPLVIAAFCLLTLALLTKAAIAPLHFWLSDAHAVAPTPVSVIFSGAMVPLGLFGFAKITHQIFAHSVDAFYLLQHVLIFVGAATAMIGGLMAWRQRHLKRMLAFSTIAHMGIVLTGLCAPSLIGLAGLVAYFIGHGLVKAALFIAIGVLPAMKASVDELDLRGLGGDIRSAGVATALGALLLAGLPLGALSGGADLIGGAVDPIAWGIPAAADLVAAGLTGAALLRAAARIYLGWGPDPGDEAEAPSAEEQEKANRPFWLLMAPCVALLAAAVLIPSSLVEAMARRYAPMLSRAPLAVAHSDARFSPWIGVAIALGVSTAAFALPRLPRAIKTLFEIATRPAFRSLDAWHSGLVTDYVAWMAVGLSLCCLAFYLR